MQGQCQVLIYPYWNVNAAPAPCALLFCPVLIYPYWNVNEAGSAETLAIRSGFNLSILECKSRDDTDFCVGTLVLIYPYWNVNCQPRQCPKRFRFVLIYPYWNVNFFRHGVDVPTDAVLIYPYWNVNAQSESAVL